VMRPRVDWELRTAGSPVVRHRGLPSVGAGIQVLWRWALQPRQVPAALGV